jgi:hypothetical protein
MTEVNFMVNETGLWKVLEIWSRSKEGWVAIESESELLVWECKGEVGEGERREGKEFCKGVSKVGLFISGFPDHVRSVPSGSPIPNARGGFVCDTDQGFIPQSVGL